MPIWGLGPVWSTGPHTAPTSYLHSFRAILGLLVAPGGSQQLSCCTADYLGVAHSLLSMSTLHVSGSVSLHLASYSSLPALQRTKDLFKSRTALWLEICPHRAVWKRSAMFPSPSSESSHRIAQLTLGANEVKMHPVTLQHTMDVGASRSPTPQYLC